MGCINRIKEAEKFSGLTLAGKIKFEKEYYQSDGFQGNCTRISIYRMVDTAYFEKQLNSKKFEQFDFVSSDNPFLNTELAPYIKGGKGYYLYVSSLRDREDKCLIVDLKNKKVIYYSILM